MRIGGNTMKHSVYLVITIFIFLLLAACDVNSSVDADRLTEGSIQTTISATHDNHAELTDLPDTNRIEELDEVPEDVAEYVRNSKDVFLILGGGEVNVDELQVGQRIPNYYVTEDGIVEGDELWPIYEDSELIGLAYKYEMDGESFFSLDFYLLGLIKDSGLNKLAVVSDNTTIWFFNGEQLVEGGSLLESEPTRTPLNSETRNEVIRTCSVGQIGLIIG